VPLSQGQILNNRYRIVGLLGQGGFGAVYRAWDLNIERPVALKENLDTSPEAQRQFKREAQILYDLSHPNLPRVSDHFSLPGQGQYLVMEFIEGEDLQQMIKRLGPLDEAQVVEWLLQVSQALAYLHTRQPPIIHRDIKPANIRIKPDGVALLVDFGVAKVYDPQLRTTIGARAITPGYAPQEQYGQGVTDARTDIYALGATAYTCLTGQVPVESIQRNLGVELVPIDTIVTGLSANTISVLNKAMQMLPEDRFQDMDEFRAALRTGTALSTSPVRVTQPASAQTRPQPIPSPYRRYLPWILFALFVVVALTVYLVIQFRSGEKGPTQETPAVQSSAVTVGVSPSPTSLKAGLSQPGVDQPDQASATATAATDLSALNLPLDPSRWQTYVSPNGINDMHLDGEIIYAATNNGLLIWDTVALSHEIITVDQGLPANDLMSVFKDAEGTLWIGSASSGLYKTQGDRFVYIAGKEELGSDFIQDITQDDQGAIWVGTRGGGASKLVGGSWQRFTPDNSPVSKDVYVIHVDEDGSLWFGSAYWGCYPCGGDLVHLVDGQWESFISTDGVTSWVDPTVTDVYAIVRLPNSGLWVGGPGGISRYLDGEWEVLFNEEVRTIQRSHDGQSVWGLTRFGEIIRFEAASGELVSRQDKSVPSAWYSTMLIDEDEIIWFSAYGINRYDPDGDILDEYSVKTDFKGAADITQAPDGLYWTVGAFWSEFEQTLSTFDGVAWSQPELPDQLDLRSIGAARDGTIGVATAEGIYLLTDGGWQSRYEDYFFNQVQEDPSGGLWFLTTNTQGLVVHYKDGTFLEYSHSEGHLPGSIFYAISFNDQGNTWIATEAGVAWIPANGDPAGIRVYDEQEGLPFNSVSDVLEDQIGRIWFATWIGISVLLPDGEWVYYPERVAGDLVEDDQGLIWAINSSQLTDNDAGWLAYFTNDVWTDLLSDVPGEYDSEYPGLLLASDGAIWANFNGFGLCRVKDLQSFCYRPGPYSLPSGYITCLFEDQSGMVWACTRGGLTHAPVNP